MPTSPLPRPYKYHKEAPWEQLHTSQTDIAPVELQGKDYNYRRPKTALLNAKYLIFCFKLMLKLFFKMLSRNAQPVFYPSQSSPSPIQRLWVSSGFAYNFNLSNKYFWQIMLLGCSLKAFSQVVSAWAAKFITHTAPCPLLPKYMT